MKKNFNVIQINGIKGLIMAGGIVACLFAGFVMFPGMVMKTVWNFISSSIGEFLKLQHYKVFCCGELLLLVILHSEKKVSWLNLNQQMIYHVMKWMR